MIFFRKDCLTKREILKNSFNGQFYDINIFKKISSTNTVALEYARKDAREGCVYMADMQTEGRGRRGKSFFSPGKTGLYMSVILKPKSATTIQLITAAAASAVAETIDEVSGKITDIKWVNDIFLDGKKVCGILAEGIFKNNAPKCIVLGIGINVYAPKKGFPPDIQEIAGSVFDNEIRGAKNLIAAKILDKIYSFYFKNADFLSVYTKKQLAVGKTVTVIAQNERYPAQCIGVTDEANLLVINEKGETIALNSGEISIKIQ